MIAAGENEKAEVIPPWIVWTGSFAILDLLVGPDYDLRRRRLMALSRLRGDMAADLIFERYQNDNLEDYPALAVSRMDPRQATPILIAALNDVHLEARLAAAEALVKQRSEESVAAFNRLI